MSFIQNCFIRKNTPELRKKLENIGYGHTPSKTECSQSECIYTHFGEWVGAYGYRDRERYYKDHIDCGTNEPLFLAIAALRDDTSIGQYWVFDEYFENHKKGDFVMGAFHRCSCYCHVATVPELIEHFKAEE